MITPLDIEAWFTYHPPTPEQLPRYQAIREGAKQFAYTIMGNSPGCADQTAALRKLRECVYSVNAAIALEGK